MVRQLLSYPTWHQVTDWRNYYLLLLSVWHILNRIRVKTLLSLYTAKECNLVHPRFSHQFNSSFLFFLLFSYLWYHSTLSSVQQCVLLKHPIQVPSSEFCLHEYVNSFSHWNIKNNFLYKIFYFGFSTWKTFSVFINWKTFYRVFGECPTYFP